MKLNPSQTVFLLTLIIVIKELFQEFLWGIIMFILIEWIWLTFITRKSYMHPRANQIGKQLWKVNFLLSLVLVITVVIILFLSSSLLGAIMFDDLGVYSVVKFGLPILIFISVIAHIVVVVRNLMRIDTSIKIPLTVFYLLLYPIGILTIQEKLKAESK